MTPIPGVRPWTFAALPLLLTLSLAGCGGDSDPEPTPRPKDEVPAPESYIRVHYQDIWLNGWMTLDGRSEPTHLSESGLQLKLCAVNDPYPVSVDDETTACVLVSFNEQLLNTGPKQLRIEGTVVIGNGDPSRTEVPVFTPLEGHAPEIQAVYIATYGLCPPAPTTEFHQAVSGTLYLEENSKSALRGRLVLQVKGPTAGRCNGGDSEADLSFSTKR